MGFVYPSIIAFLAWVVCVYDYIMFGTLLPKMADDFGGRPRRVPDRDHCVDRDLLRSHLRGADDRLCRSKRSLIITTAGTGLSSLLTGLTLGVFGIYLTIIRSISGLGYSERRSIPPTSTSSTVTGRAGGSYTPSYRAGGRSVYCSRRPSRRCCLEPLDGAVCSCSPPYRRS